MNLTKLCMSLLIAVGTTAALAEDLSPLEQKREVLVIGTLILDAAQTMDIKNHPGVHESNPILGKHPSDTKVATYFAAMGYAHYAITKEIPKDYRAAWQYGWAALELGTIIRNHKLNLRFNF